MIKAFEIANSCGRDYKKLVELANFCADVTAHLGLETEWCNAVQELCCSSLTSSNWDQMLLDINVCLTLGILAILLKILAIILYIILL